MGGSWSKQQWLEAYAKALQCIGEAAEGRKWVPVDKNFTPRVSPLVKAFLGVPDVDVKEDCAMDCWGDNPEQVPQQKDKGAHAKVISYLNELATHRPSRKSWDELVWSPQSTMPVLPCERVSPLQGCIVKMGSAMPPTQFCISHPSRAFICFARAFVFEGNALTYD